MVIQSYPVVLELREIILDNFAETLIETMQANRKFGGLNTEAVLKDSSAQ